MLLPKEGFKKINRIFYFITHNHLYHLQLAVLVAVMGCVSGCCWWWVVALVGYGGRC